MRRSLILIIMMLCRCAEPGSGSSTSADATDAADLPDMLDALDATVATDATDATGADSAQDTAPDVPSAGPDNPSVGCLRDAECEAGEVCCTLPISYLSDCVIRADCNPGLHDACLTDEQCAARRPGEWTACCHDRGDRNYCAPVAATCQPLVPCTTPAECAGNGNDICCSPHPYYEGSFCTSEFFAVPDRDCD